MICFHEKKFIVSVILLIFLLIFSGACKSPFGDISDPKNVSSSDFCPFSKRTDNGHCPVGTPFNLNFDFSSGADYLCEGGTCDSEHIAVASGQAALREVDLKIDTQTEWTAAGSTQLGVTTPGDSLVLDAATNYSELDASWTPQWDNIVGYWKLNDDQSDSIGTNNATLGGGAAFVTAAKLGSHSVSFDGVDDFVTLGDILDDTTFVGDGKKFSFSIWVKPGLDNMTNKVIVGKYETWNSQRQFVMVLKTDNKVGFVLYSDLGTGNYNFVAGSTPITDANKWYHVALTYDGTGDTSVNRIKIYINGNAESATEIDSVGTMTYIRDGTGPLSLGASVDISESSSAYELTGQLDDFAIWNVELTSAQVAHIYARQSAKYAGIQTSPVFDIGTSSSWPNLFWQSPLPFYKELPGLSGNESQTDYSATVDSSGSAGDSDLWDDLISLWHLNESSWSGALDEVIDSSGNEHHGQVINGATTSSFGQFHRAGIFDGVNDYVRVADSSLNLTGDISVSLWINTISTEIEVPFHKYCSQDEHGWVIVILPDGTCKFDGRNGTGTYYSSGASTASVNDGRWHHILGQREGTTWKIYVDGRLENSDSHPGSSGSFATTRNLEFGGKTYGNYYCPCKLDELAIWNRALHANEILGLYRRGANRIKFQARSCDDNACDSETWMGPDGTNQTYFSELHNNDTIDGSGNPSPTGEVQTTLPFMLFSDFVTAPADNRYFQVRSILESDDENNLCSGAACMPEIGQYGLLSRTGNVVEGDEQNKYWGGTPTPTIVNKVAKQFFTLSSISITETGSCTPKYQISSDGGTTFYYHSGGWTAALNETTHTSTKAQVEANIGTFPVGSGQFKFKALLSSDTDSDCGISNIEIIGEN